MKYIIRWDYGFGNNYDIVEADSLDEARGISYEEWRQDAEDSADYDAVEWTQDLQDKYGL